MPAHARGVAARQGYCGLNQGYRHFRLIRFRREPVDMMPSLRYAFAFIINVLLPATAYRLALGRFGIAGALVASMIPLLLWLVIDLARFRHVDALSAVVLAGLVMSWSLLVLKPAQWLVDVREPLVSGVIGALFLVSLTCRRPVVFYLARSTLSRERQGGEREFDAMWKSRPALVRSIRLMTAVWGIGLVAENIVRLGVLDHLRGDDAERASTLVRYGFYGALTAWTIFYRRAYIRKQASPGH
jgi:hypothetical protein